MAHLIPAIILLAALVAAPPAAAQTTARPNVVIFLADDLGWADVGFHGSEIRTPHLDRLAQEGVELGRFYVMPVCSPTRAALMTGRSPVRFGVIYSVVRPWSNAGVPLEERLLPQYFREAGYQTAIFGKWHLGHAHVRQLPHNRGFDRYYGHVNGAIDYFTHEREGGVDWQRNGATEREVGYSTELLAREAVQWLEARDPSKPFLLYMPFNAPHTPLQATQVYLDKYAAIEDRTRRMFAAMVDALDTAVGRVLATLESQGVANDTLVLFFSDNGGPTEFGARNTPLRGQKGTTFEGGIRVPAVMRWPGRLPAGAKSRQVASAIDLLPTLAAAAGVDIPAAARLDGVNLWEALRSGRPVDRPPLFFANANQNRVLETILDGDWKYILESPRDGSAPTEHLYWLASDPAEAQNLAQTRAAQRQRLAAELAQWKRLHPRGGIIFDQAAHPGWVAPTDWAAGARKD